MDAALYLSRIGELTQTQKNIVHNSEDEDQQQEQKVPLIACPSAVFLFLSVCLSIHPTS